MPWSARKPTAIEIAPDWLKPYCEQFLKNLVNRGYAPATMRTYEGAARLLCKEIARRGLRKGEFRWTDAISDARRRAQGDASA